MDKKKILIIVTGRGLGGDAGIALNVYNALEKRGYDCEIALDELAPGILFKKNNISWNKLIIPQAGGHSATISTTIKAAIRALRAVFKTKKLLKSKKFDLELGILGGGAIVGALGAKLARIPSVSLLITPLDTKICRHIGTPIILPENNLFLSNDIPDNMVKSFLPVNDNISHGDKNKALEKIKKHSKDIKEKNPNAIQFDESKPTIVFSSGSSLFEKTAQAIDQFSKYSDKYNLVLVGHPLKDDFYKYIDETKIINLGFIDWVNDLLYLANLAVLTNDGLMLHEAMVCNLPVVILKRVKYGRYHDMVSIFKGATVECDLEDLDDAIFKVMDNYDEFAKRTNEYRTAILNVGEMICDIVDKSLEN
ncbi:glycosyltransferase [Methanobrevibacter olleyae]|uniref:Cell wall biosynthesis protein UDP-glycosyltransferase family n=1 Tax=Methanobrevibacter olleyae TaxID=294671 RepID=A0A126R2H7_METOL|nr:glycosyltransferase [Methanobrevibacter olleyae]AMK16246.1 cell wall biosynthesis protein UDP-glycosyltransferase family [Methanobrevibacter olleyae]SFL64520.1 UDP-N-acetylglucosamine--N-acetylmuramyl-(pentapeptide) pyrophosphoryl-undecaprenol N-acetylglucosamine transferase [Methanobrevibacter olleyae]